MKFQTIVHQSNNYSADDEETSISFAPQGPQTPRDQLNTRRLRKQDQASLSFLWGSIDNSG
jgi:hypothetical protein